MLRYIIKRLITMIVTLFLIMLLTFVMMHAIPGGPYSGQKRLPPAVEQAINEKYKLTDPLFVQFGDYLKRVVRFDFGPSFKYSDRSVNELISMGFPVSAKLGLLSMGLILMFGIPLGILAGLNRGKWPDSFIMFIATIGVTVPSFVTSTIFIFIFSTKLKVYDILGKDDLVHYLLPAIALAGFYIAFVSRLMRSSLLDVMNQDYIRTAKVKGISNTQIIVRHGLRNAIIPVITVLGPTFAGLLMGSFVVEKIFVLPGMGQFFVLSITNRDYTAIMGFTIFYASMLLFIVFIIDLLYGIIDPRIKLY